MLECYTISTNWTLDSKHWRPLLNQVWNQYTSKCYGPEPCPTAFGNWVKDADGKQSYLSWEFEDPLDCLRMRYDPKHTPFVQLKGTGDNDPSNGCTAQNLGGKKQNDKMCRGLPASIIQYRTGVFSKPGATYDKLSQAICINSDGTQYSNMSSTESCWKYLNGDNLIRSKLSTTLIPA